MSASALRVRVFIRSMYFARSSAACFSHFPACGETTIVALVTAIQQPFTATDTLGRFDIMARVDGGGLTGQAGALRLAVARALVKLDETHRRKLRDLGLLTRDARAVERKKPGRPKARKKFQFSKR